VKVYEGTLAQSSQPAESCDAVTMLDAIEHLPDPYEVVAEAQRILKPGGVLFVLTPDLGAPVAWLMGSWWWGLRPAHLHYFSRATLSSLMEKTGFTVRAVSHWGRRFTLGYWISRLHGYAPRLIGSAGGIARAVRLDRLPVYINTFDSIAVVAVKKAS
jgi:SAM-dependent methyltransferase